MRTQNDFPLSLLRKVSGLPTGAGVAPWQAAGVAGAEVAGDDCAAGVLLTGWLFPQAEAMADTLMITAAARSGTLRTRSSLRDGGSPAGDDR